MSVTKILATALVFGIEQLVQSRYGVAGFAALTLVTVGLKSNNVALSSLGAAVLALLIAAPGL